MGAVAAGVDDALGNALVVEVEDLFAKGEVLEQRRPALAGAQRVLVVGNEDALRSGHRRTALARCLMGLAPVPRIALALGGLVSRLGVGRGLEERRRRFLWHGSLRNGAHALALRDRAPNQAPAAARTTIRKHPRSCSSDVASSFVGVASAPSLLRPRIHSAHPPAIVDQQRTRRVGIPSRDAFSVEA